MRVTKILITTCVLVGLWSFAGAAAMAAPSPFQPGVSYVSVTPDDSTTVAPGKIEVIEFFWYGCPHCYAFDPYVEAWLKHKPANVVFKRIPIAMDWGEHMNVDGHAFYAAQALGLEPKIHVPLFNAIHKDRQLALVSDQDALQQFFAKYGVTKQQFNGAWNSFAVNLKMNRAKALEQHYGVDSVPTVIIDGKWKTGAVYKAHGQYMEPAELIKCVEMLVQKAEHQKH